MSALQDRDTWSALAAAIAPQMAADSVTITATSRLPGGAVQENWRLDVVVLGGHLEGTRTWVLRTDSSARLSVSLDRNAEGQVMRAAAIAGVTVADVVAEGTADGPLGRPFVVQRWLKGSAMARRIVRDPALDAIGPQLASQLAAELARIHSLTPASSHLACLPVPLQPPAKTEVARLRSALDNAGDARPALEYVLSWLDRYTPPARALTLVHGDFRTGNYMVDDGRLTGILDWEFAHWGDPDEDIGWFTARCWRFGRDGDAAGGIAPLQTFLSAYTAASSRIVNLDAVRYWQIMAAAKWATISVLQGDRLRIGGERRLELALTGLMPAAMEHDALSEIVAWQVGDSDAGGPKWH